MNISILRVAALVALQAGALFAQSLGLRPEPAKTQTEVIVVDHLEKPSDN